MSRPCCAERSLTHMDRKSILLSWGIYFNARAVVVVSRGLWSFSRGRGPLQSWIMQSWLVQSWIVMTFFWKWIPPKGQLGGRRAFILVFSEISENGFPPKGQLGGRRAFQKVRFLKMDSPRRGNWGGRRAFQKVKFLKMDSPEGAIGRKKSFSKS